MKDYFEVVMQREKKTMKNLMIRSGVLAIGFVLGTGCATTGSKKDAPIVAADETPAAIFDAGERALVAQQNENAKNLFLKGLTLQPSNDAAKVGLADAYVRLGLFADARPILEAQYEGSPKNRRILELLGRTYQENKETAARGLTLFLGLFKENDRDELVLTQLAGLYRVDGQYDESVSMCKRILERNPESIAALKTLSFTYFESGKYTLAETIAVNVLEKGDKDPVLYNNRGMIRVYKKQYLKAQPFFQKALELDAKMTEPHLNLGAISLRYRDYATAEKHFGAVLKNDSRHPSANLGMGYAMGGLQKGEEAIKQLEKALEIKPDEIDVYAEITVIYKFQMADLDNALLWANKYLEAKGGTLADSDPMKIQLDNIKMEIEGAKMAEEAMAESEAEESEEAAVEEPEAEVPSEEAAEPAEGEAPAPVEEGAS
jgi:tetratricopeptide (TPR) repeat protein